MPAPEAINDLNACLDASWAAFNAGASPGKSAFSMIQIASVGEDGRPRARTVVIRACDRASRELAFHTDIRSPKVREFHRDPRVSVIGYDMEAGRQVRGEGLARLHSRDDVALSAWSEARRESRICYRSAYSPGDELETADLGDPTADAQDPAEDSIGYENFCKVVITLDLIEWLDLRHAGHRRALFQWEGGDWRNSWLAP